MSAKKRGLGKGLSDLGLSELLGDMSSIAAPVPEAGLIAGLEEKPSTQFKMLAVHLLKPGRYQPRRQMPEDKLQELAASIRTQGIIQPIVVRNLNDGYEIIAGERRWRAAQLADKTEVPVIVRDLDDEAVLAISLIENIQRQDLNVIEEATALQRLIGEFNMTHQEVAKAVGKSRASVTNLLRLLKLNPDVLSLVEHGKLDMGHARALLALEGSQQSELSLVVVERSLSVRETEKLIQKTLQPASPNQEAQMDDGEDIRPDIPRLQRSLSNRFGAKVTIRHSPQGKGKLVIHYVNTSELDSILEKMQ